MPALAVVEYLMKPLKNVPFSRYRLSRHTRMRSARTLNIDIESPSLTVYDGILPHEESKQRFRTQLMTLQLSDSLCPREERSAIL